MAKIETGISESDQEGGFMNATLQGAGNLAFSIQTEFEVPAAISVEGEAAVSGYLAAYLAIAEAAVPGLRFTVQLGLARG